MKQNRDQNVYEEEARGKVIVSGGPGQDPQNGPGVGLPKADGGGKQVITAGNHTPPESADDDQDPTHGPGVK